MPDHGFPRGVVEIAGPVGDRGGLRGGATTMALAVVGTAQATDARAWCAWITPEGTPMLYAPAVVQAGVDLERLLVARPKAVALARTAVKAAASGAFSVVVVDAFTGLEGRSPARAGRSPPSNAAVVVRKLALAAEDVGTTTVLLTDDGASRAVPWPVALRLEVERQPDSLVVRVAKDRHGRVSSAHLLGWPLGAAVAGGVGDESPAAASRPRRLASAKPFYPGVARG